MPNALIVSYYFPPFNSIASIRVSQFAYWLSRLGWKTIILTANNSQNCAAPLDQLIDEASIIRIGGNDPYERLRKVVKRMVKTPRGPYAERHIKQSGESKKLKWLRTFNPISNVRWPDNAIWWQNKALKAGLFHLAQHPTDIIFSSCGPPSSHIIASKLSKISGIPWVADYRDLWSLNHMVKRPWPLQILEEKFECHIIRRVAHITTVSHDLSNQIKLLFKIEDRVTVIHNGFETKSYASLNPRKSEKFTISYTGNIYPHQDPRPFITAIKRLKDANIISNHNCQALFYGNNLHPIRPLAEELGVSDIVKCCGIISHTESLQRQLESDILLMFGWQRINQKGIVTGKLFEYMGANRPILCTGPGIDEIEAIIKETRVGTYCCGDNDTFDTLNRWVEEWQSSGMVDFNPNHDRVNDFSCQRLSKKLSDVFDAVIKTQSHQLT